MSKRLGRPSAEHINPKTVDQYILRMQRELKPLFEGVAHKHKIAIADLLGACRERKVVKARAELVHILYNERNLSSSQIGAILGRDHSSILHLLGHTKRGAEMKAKHRKDI